MKTFAHLYALTYERGVASRITRFNINLHANNRVNKSIDEDKYYGNANVIE